jgi:hypothetical protein
VARAPEWNRARPSWVSAALGYLVSFVTFVVEVIPKMRFLRQLAIASAVVFLDPAAHAWGQTDSKLAAAPSGFANRRDGVERGKVETVEYDSKSVGDTRKMTVYLPPRLLEEHQVSGPLSAARRR